MTEAVDRIEPARIDDAGGDLPDLIAEISARAEALGRALHPRTAASLAGVVRIMNTYYSNLIEGHNTRPRAIARALAEGIGEGTGNGDGEDDRRDLRIEAVAHVRVQEAIDRQAAEDRLPDPSDPEFIRDLHRAFYAGASDTMLTIRGKTHSFRMVPGEWRTGAEQEVEVGDHLPPASNRVPDFMGYFHRRYAFDPPPEARLLAVGAGKGKRILATAAAHHRFNYIHPFPDGNGRVSRLMSHAMAHRAGIGAHGLWSIARGLARGLDPGPAGRAEYKQHMAWADAVRQGDRDGRGHLSLRGLNVFVTWFLKICLDQLTYMEGLFDLATLSARLDRYVRLNEALVPEAALLLQEALVRGEFERGATGRITGLPERSARRALATLVDDGLLASATPKGPVSLRFPSHTLEILFPRLYPEGV